MVSKQNFFEFLIKLHLDGSIDRYKAHLVVLGNKQEYGLMTFALVAKMTSVHTILALAASQSWQSGKTMKREHSNLI
jgi:hypothetical protein